MGNTKTRARADAVAQNISGEHYIRSSFKKLFPVQAEQTQVVTEFEPSTCLHSPTSGIE